MSEAKAHSDACIQGTTDDNLAEGVNEKLDSDGGLYPDSGEYFGDISDRRHIADDDDDEEEEIKSDKLRIYDDILNLGAGPSILVEIPPYGGIALLSPRLRTPDILLNQVPINHQHITMASHAQNGSEFKDMSDDFACKDEVPVLHTHGGSGRTKQYSFKISVLNLKSATIDRYVRLLYHLGELQMSEDGRAIVLFEFVTDAHSEMFELSLCGYTQAVDHCVERIFTMVKQALTTTKLRRLDLPNWCIQHVLAMKGSMELLEMEKVCQVILRFYIVSPTLGAQSVATPGQDESQPYLQRQNCVGVELFGGSTEQREQLLSILKDLTPRSTTWELPHNILPFVYRGPYAVYIEPKIASEKSCDVVVAKVWGFDKGPELALQDLLLGAKGDASLTSMRKAWSPTLEIPSQLLTPSDSAYSSPLSDPTPNRGETPSLADIANMALSEWSDNDESIMTEPSCNSISDNLMSTSLEADVQIQAAHDETPLTVKVSSKDRAGTSRFLAAAPMSPSIRPRIKLGGEFGCHASFSFQDREAGIYFQAFQHAFAKSFRHAFGTVMAPLEAFEEVHNSPAKSSGSSTGSSGSRSIEHTRALRVDIFGKSGKACQQAISYLSNEFGCKLSRVILSFPRADERVSKALIEVKEKLDKSFASEREQDAVRRREILKLPSGTAVVQNPLEAEGFVHIRFKPFGAAKLKSQGYKKLHLPVDISVTISGPMASPAHLAAIARCERAFKAVRSNHHMAEIAISSANPFAKIIIPKTSREQFVAKYGLVALRIDELARRGDHDGTGVKPPGLAGVACIWAPTAQALSSVMHQLQEGEREAESATQLKMATIAASGLTLNFNLNETQREYREVVNRAPFLNEDPLLDPNLRAEAVEKSGPSVLNSFAQQLISPNSTRSVVHWPHPSTRFAFLEAGMKSALASLVQGYRQLGVSITTPFRDKKDASACMLIEAGSDDLSDKHLMRRAATAVQHFMQSVAQRLFCMQLKLPKDLLDNLARGDLSELKILQGALGVHIILYPTADDMRECTRFFDVSAYDRKTCKTAGKVETSHCLPEQLSPASANLANNLQSPFCDLGQNPLSPINSFKGASSNFSGDGSLESSQMDSEDPVMQLSFDVKNSISGLNINIQVVEDSFSHWNQYGASALVVVLDVNADLTLSKAEIAQLAAGQALVHIDREHNRAMLRVRPEKKIEKIDQSRALAACLNTALDLADSMGVEGVALIAPAFNSLLGNLTPNELKTETGGTVLRFARFARVSHIRLLVCLEDEQEELEEANCCLASLAIARQKDKNSLSLDHIPPGDRTPNALARALNYWLEDLVREGVCSLVVRDARVQSPQIPSGNSASRYNSSPLGKLAVPRKLENYAKFKMGKHVDFISLDDTEVLRSGGKCNGLGLGTASGKGNGNCSGNNSVIVIKGLRNNVLNAVNALWSLKSGFLERESQGKDRWASS
jgi:hypothetical protein